MKISTFFLFHLVLTSRNAAGVSATTIVRELSRVRSVSSVVRRLESRNQESTEDMLVSYRSLAKRIDKALSTKSNQLNINYSNKKNLNSQIQVNDITITRLSKKS